MEVCLTCDAMTRTQQSFKTAAVRSLLRDPRADGTRVREAIWNLEERDLNACGLSAFLLNLTAIFGNKLQPSQVRHMAVETIRNFMWNGWAYRAYLVTDGARPVLADFPLEKISQLHEQCRGLVITGFAYGASRYIPSDISLAGIQVTLALAGEAYADYCVFRSENPSARVWRNLRPVNVEAPGGGWLCGVG
jgi:hypothetical protein